MLTPVGELTQRSARGVYQDAPSTHPGDCVT
jgi:hypothetical protein